MSENSNPFKPAHQQPDSLSGTSEQGTEILLFQHQHIEPGTLSSLQIENNIDPTATSVLDLPDSSSTTEDQANTEAANWSTQPGTGDGAWEYMVPVYIAPTETDKLVVFIDSIFGMVKFLPVLSRLQRGVPELFCGCKGNAEGLSRDGRVTIFTTSIKSLNTTYIFDVHVLENRVFDMVGYNGLSLRNILESEAIMKVWWDLRSDFEALSHHFNIHPKFYRDLQLLELMSSKGNRAKLSGLANAVRTICLENPGEVECVLGDVSKWNMMKQETRDYFDWNGFEELEKRPVSIMVLKNCRGDTEIMPGLYDFLIRRLWKTNKEMRMGSFNLFLDIIDEESVIRAEVEWSKESTNGFSINREIVNHSKSRSPPIFRMLLAVYDWGREDEWHE